jgi:hypothetical protein
MPFLCSSPELYVHFILFLKLFLLGGPPLWISGQSSWLQIRRPGFDFLHYQKKKVVGLERGPLSLVSTTEELLERKSSGSCLENREYGRRDPSCRPLGTFYPQKLAITSPSSGGRSVGIVRSRTQSIEFFSTWGILYLPSCDILSCFLHAY